MLLLGSNWLTDGDIKLTVNKSFSVEDFIRGLLFPLVNFIIENELSFFTEVDGRVLNRSIRVRQFSRPSCLKLWMAFQLSSCILSPYLMNKIRFIIY
jgi:hypothetical protein